MYHINRIYGKNHIVISIDEEKYLRNLNVFMMNTLNKLGREGRYLNMTDNLHKKPTANIILIGESLRISLLRSETRQGCTLSPL